MTAMPTKIRGGLPSITLEKQLTTRGLTSRMLILDLRAMGSHSEVQI